MWPCYTQVAAPYIPSEATVGENEPSEQAEATNTPAQDLRESVMCGRTVSKFINATYSDIVLLPRSPFIGCVQEDLEEALWLFYSKYAPAKVKNVEQIVEVRLKFILDRVIVCVDDQQVNIYPRQC